MRKVDKGRQKSETWQIFKKYKCEIMLHLTKVTLIIEKNYYIKLLHDITFVT